jgi:peptidoglycan/LPS O-acetylase OafA/YrhL
MNLLLFAAFIPQFTLFPGGWSINYEWIFSFIILIFFKFKSINTKKFLITLLVLASVISEKVISDSTIDPKNSNVNITYLGFLVNIIFLYLGVLVRQETIKLKIKYFYFLIPSTIILAIFYPFPNTFYTIWFFSILLMIILVFNLKISIFLNSFIIIKIISFLGKRTYGLFCGHFIAMILIQKIGPGKVSLIDYLNTYFYDFFAKTIYFILTLFSSIVFAYFCYKYIELPQIKLVRKFIANKKW